MGEHWAPLTGDPHIHFESGGMWFDFEIKVFSCTFGVHSIVIVVYAKNLIAEILFDIFFLLTYKYSGI